jgi:hypothetical protein
VSERAPGRGVVVGRDRPLFGALDTFAREARLVFFAGLPGTGKSLLIHQLAHLAHGRGRRIHLLQWDVARPVFEATEAGGRYPQVGGVTHGVIRLAVGRWARAAIARWHGDHPGREALLIGETPLIGHRLIELAWPTADPAEPVLSAPWTRFVVPVPSPALRAHLETERARRARTPLHAREREDAPPAVLRELWRELLAVARRLGAGSGALDDHGYDPDTYRRVYTALLAHRHTETLPLEVRLPVEGLSAYDFAIPAADLVPAPDEAARAILDVEGRGLDPAALAAAIDGWWRPRCPGRAGEG